MAESILDLDFKSSNSKSNDILRNNNNTALPKLKKPIEKRASSPHLIPEFTPTPSLVDEPSLRLLRLRRPSSLNVISTSEKLRSQPTWGFNLTRSKWDPYPWVSGVDVGTPAAVCGLRAGDCILEVNDIDVLGYRIADIAKMIKEMHQPAEMMTLLVWRSGQKCATEGTNCESISCGPMPHVLQRLSAIVQSVLSLIECPVCMRTITPPALQCQNGHLICVECRVRAVNCPVCRGFYTPQRALVAEQILSAIENGMTLSDGPSKGPKCNRNRNRNDGDNKLRQHLFGECKETRVNDENVLTKDDNQRTRTKKIGRQLQQSRIDVLAPNNVAATATNQLKNLNNAATFSKNDDEEVVAAATPTTTPIPTSIPINDVVNVATNDEAIGDGVLAINRATHHFSHSKMTTTTMKEDLLSTDSSMHSCSSLSSSSSSSGVSSLASSSSLTTMAADDKSTTAGPVDDEQKDEEQEGRTNAKAVYRPPNRSKDVPLPPPRTTSLRADYPIPASVDISSPVAQQSAMQVTKCFAITLQNERGGLTKSANCNC